MLNLSATSGHITYATKYAGEYVQHMAGSTINFKVVSIKLTEYQETDQESQPASVPIKGLQFTNCELFSDFHESFLENTLKIANRFSYY